MEFLPEEDTVEWAEKHSIEIKQDTCKKCGMDQETSIPFIKGDLVGLFAPFHDCGNDYCLVSAVRRKK